MIDQKITALFIFAACLFIFIYSGCNSRDDYVGHYRAVGEDTEIHKETEIELLENGEGTWACCDGEVLFTWYIKEDELRINTKEGGIMVGTLKKDAFRITLPGRKTLMFVKDSL